MKIMFVLHSMTNTGGGRLTSLLANYWASKSKEIKIITFVNESMKSDYQLVKGIELIQLDVDRKASSLLIRLVFHIKSIFLLKRQIKKIKPSVIISLTTYIGIILIIPAFIEKTPVIISEHTDPKSYEKYFFWNFMRTFFYKFAAHIVISNKKSLNYFRKNFKDKTSLIYNPFSPLHIKPPKYNSRSKIIIAMGVLEYIKGFDILFKSFQVVLQKYKDWQLFILGKGDLRTELEDLCHELKIKENVFFLGWVKNIEEFFKKGSFFVLSSRTEEFSLSILEALSNGLPVISTACHGPKELIIHEKNGFLVPIDNITELSNKMQLLIKNSALRKKISNNIPESLKPFQMERIISKWEKIINNNLTR